VAILGLLPAALVAQDEIEPRRIRRRAERAAPAQTAPAANPDASAAVIRVPSPGGDIRRGGRPEVFFCDQADTQCRTSANSFSVDEIRDLFVFVTWPHLSGQHVQTLEFVLPDGNLYQRIGSQFTARPDRPEPDPRRKGGSGNLQPQGQRFLTTSRGVPTVGTVLPVAGTFITQRSLLGNWTLHVYLDGQLITSSQFTLKRGDDESSPPPTFTLPSPIDDRPGKTR
jgi:hypothetical protein